MTDYCQRALLAAVMLLAFSGCARIYENVDTTYNRSVDFSALETYNWSALYGTDETGEGDLALIRRYVDTDLQAKGLRQVEENPDFLVVVYLRKAPQVETQEVHSSRTTDWRFGPHSQDYEGGPVTWSYEEGTMVVAFVRPQTNHMVWRGVFETNLNAATTPEERTAVIERAVKKIMREFPPS